MKDTWYRWKNDTLILRIRVQPRSGRDEVAGPYDNQLKVRLTAPPVDGLANKRLTEIIAREFRVPRTQVRLLNGAGAREKRLAVQAPRVYPAWFPERKGSSGG